MGIVCACIIMLAVKKVWSEQPENVVRPLKQFIFPNVCIVGEGRDRKGQGGAALTTSGMESKSRIVGQDEHNGGR
uniref:Uncharacterized protein n=1 Tax=Parascaris equorum TaxID=6256 RepID=A0A914RV26_PAREQ